MIMAIINTIDINKEIAAIRYRLKMTERLKTQSLPEMQGTIGVDICQ